MIVEKAVAEVTQYKRGGVFKGGLTELLKQTTKVAKNESVENLRMSYLYDGLTPSNELEIPNLQIFRENTYRQHKIPKLSKADLKQFVLFNNQYNHNIGDES